MRRLVCFASEDVGTAALTLTLTAKEAYDFLGSPETELAPAQATVYLALAPKSNAVWVGFGEAWGDADVGNSRSQATDARRTGESSRSLRSVNPRLVATASGEA